MTQPAPSERAAALDRLVADLLEQNDGYRKAAEMLWNNDWSKQAIADRLGVAWITVHRWLDSAYAERGRTQRREHARQKRAEARDV